MFLLRAFVIIFFVIGQIFSQEKQVDQKTARSLCGDLCFSRLDFRHTEHKGMGFDQGYTTASLYLFPKKARDFIPFVNANFHLFNNLYIASNVGLGLRFSGGLEDFVFGINGFYDYRNYKSLTTHQASGGIEMLSQWMNFSANAYIPFSGKVREEDVFFKNFTGHQIIAQEKVRYALKHFDTEINFNLPGYFKQVNLSMGLGYYYLAKRKSSITTVGPSSGGLIRLKAKPLRYFSLGVEYTYDKIFKSRINGTISFNIPLGPSKLKESSASKYPYTKSPCDIYYDHMKLKTQDITRDNIIPMYSKDNKFPYLNAADTTAHVLFVNNLATPIPIGSGSIASGDGTAEDPFTTLAQANAVAKENDIIYVYYGDGTSAGYNTGFILQSGQILTSSGIDITINGLFIPAKTPGQFAKLTNTSGSVVLATNNNNLAEIQGFELEGSPSGNVVEILGSSININGNTLTSSGNYSAIAIADVVGDSIITNNVLSSYDGTSGVGLIEFTSAQDLSKGKINIQNNTITSSQGLDGIRINEFAKDLIIQNNTILSSSPNGNAVYLSDTSHFSKNLNMTNNTIINGFEKAININWNNNAAYNFTIKNTIISSPTVTNGLICASKSENGVLNFSNNTLSDINGVGINISGIGHNGKIKAQLSKNNISSTGKAIYLTTNTHQKSAQIEIFDNNAITSSSNHPIDIDIGGVTKSCSIDVSRNNLTCESDKSAIKLSTNDKSDVTVANNSISYPLTPLSGASAIDLTTSSANLLTTTYSISGNSLDNASASQFLTATSLSNARSILDVSNNMNTANLGGSISVIQTANQPICSNITNNFNTKISSTSQINLTKTGSGTLQVISSTAPSLEGVASSNNIPLSGISTTGAIIAAPTGTPCPPFEGIYVDNSAVIPSGATRNGSFAYPYAFIKEAFLASNAGDIIYIRPGAGYNINELILPKGSSILNVKDGQTIAGSGSYITVAGSVVDPLDPGTKPRLNFNNNSYTFIGVNALASSATIQGLQLVYDHLSSGGATTMLEIKGPAQMTIKGNEFILNYPNSTSGISRAILFDETNLTQTIKNNLFSINTALTTSGETSEVIRFEQIQTGSSQTIDIVGNGLFFNNRGIVFGETNVSGSKTYTLNIQNNTIENTLSDVQRAAYPFADALALTLDGDNSSKTNFNLMGNTITSLTTLQLSGSASTVTSTVKQNYLLGTDLKSADTTLPLFGVTNNDTKASFIFNSNVVYVPKSNTTVNFLNDSPTYSICQTSFEDNYFKNYIMQQQDAKTDKPIMFFVSEDTFISDQRLPNQSLFTLSGATFSNSSCPN